MKSGWGCAMMEQIRRMGGEAMTHIQTLNGATLKSSTAYGGCGECQTSCQSACKTSCTVANQTCEHQK